MSVSPSDFDLKSPNVINTNARVLDNFNPLVAKKVQETLMRHGFALPIPTTDGYPMVTPLCDVSNPLAAVTDRLIPGISVIYMVPDYYSAATSLTAFAPLSQMPQTYGAAATASGHGEIRNNAGVLLAAQFTAGTSASGLEGAYRVIELLEQAQHYVNTLDSSEQTAREAFSARIPICQSVLEAVHNARSETPVFYPVFLTVAGNPLNPKERSTLVRCGDRWAIGSGLNEDQKQSLMDSLVTLVKTKCGMTPNKPYLRKLSASFQQLSVANNPSMRTCTARIYRAGLATSTLPGSMRIHDHDQHTNALCVHLGAVANFLGQEGVDSAFATLQSAFPALLDVTEQTVVSRLLDHIGLPATILNLVGASGTGKTEGVHELHRRLQLQLPYSTAMHLFQCHPGATAADMIGRINQVIQDGAPRYEWTDGPLAKAWKAAAGSATTAPKLTIFFADEINRMPMAELQAFIAMLSPDKEGYLSLQTRKSILNPRTGQYETEVLRAPAKNLIFISAMNAGANFQVEQLDLAILSRMRTIFIGYNVDSLVATLKYHMNVDANDIPCWNTLLTGFLAAVTDNTLRAPLDLRQINRILQELKHATLPPSFNNHDKIAFGMMKAISDFVTFTSTGALSESEIAAIHVIISTATPNRTVSSLDDLYAEGQEVHSAFAGKALVAQFALS